MLIALKFVRYTECFYLNSIFIDSKDYINLYKCTLVKFLEENFMCKNLILIMFLFNNDSMSVLTLAIIIFLDIRSSRGS